MTVFPTLRGLRQEDSKFKVSLGYKKKESTREESLGVGTVSLSAKGLCALM
jgi:hypothetical protein